MTSFVEASAERYPSGIRGEMTTTGREPAAQQPVGPPRWKLAALSWFGVFPVVTATLALAEPWLDRLPLVARTFALTVAVSACHGVRCHAGSYPGVPILAATLVPTEWFAATNPPEA